MLKKLCLCIILSLEILPLKPIFFKSSIFSFVVGALETIIAVFFVFRKYDFKK